MNKDFQEGLASLLLTPNEEVMTQIEEEEEEEDIKKPITVSLNAEESEALNGIYSLTEETTENKNEVTERVEDTERVDKEQLDISSAQEDMKQVNNDNPANENRNENQIELLSLDSISLIDNQLLEPEIDNPQPNIHQDIPPPPPPPPLPLSSTTNDPTPSPTLPIIDDIPPPPLPPLSNKHNLNNDILEIPPASPPPSPPPPPSSKLFYQNPSQEMQMDISEEEDEPNIPQFQVPEHLVKANEILLDIGYYRLKKNVKYLIANGGDAMLTLDKILEDTNKYFEEPSSEDEPPEIHDSSSSSVTPPISPRVKIKKKDPKKLRKSKKHKKSNSNLANKDDIENWIKKMTKKREEKLSTRKDGIFEHKRKYMEAKYLSLTIDETEAFQLNEKVHEHILYFILRYLGNDMKSILRLALTSKLNYQAIMNNMNFFWGQLCHQNLVQYKEEEYAKTPFYRNRFKFHATFYDGGYTFKPKPKQQNLLLDAMNSDQNMPSIFIYLKTSNNPKPVQVLRRASNIFVQGGKKTKLYQIDVLKNTCKLVTDSQDAIWQSTIDATSNSLYIIKERNFIEKYDLEQYEGDFYQQTKLPKHPFEAYNYSQKEVTNNTKDKLNFETFTKVSNEKNDASQLDETPENESNDTPSQDDTTKHQTNDAPLLDETTEQEQKNTSCLGNTTEHEKNDSLTSKRDKKESIKKNVADTYQSLYANKEGLNNSYEYIPSQINYISNRKQIGYGATNLTIQQFFVIGHDTKLFRMDSSLSTMTSSVPSTSVSVYKDSVFLNNMKPSIYTDMNVAIPSNLKGISFIDTHYKNLERFLPTKIYPQENALSYIKRHFYMFVNENYVFAIALQAPVSQLKCYDRVTGEVISSCAIVILKFSFFFMAVGNYFCKSNRSGSLEFYKSPFFRNNAKFTGTPTLLSSGKSLYIGITNPVSVHIVTYFLDTINKEKYATLTEVVQKLLPSTSSSSDDNTNQLSPKQRHALNLLHYAPHLITNKFYPELDGILKRIKEQYLLVVVDINFKILIYEVEKVPSSSCSIM